MARYHITPTGNPGVCRAKHSCPFGDASAHYSSKEEARSAYEQIMNGSVVGNLSPSEELTLVLLSELGAQDNSRAVPTRTLTDESIHRKGSSSLSRTTIDRALTSLREQGLVSPITWGGNRTRYWKLSPQGQTLASTYLTRPSPVETPKAPAFPSPQQWKTIQNSLVRISECYQSAYSNLYDPEGVQDDSTEEYFGEIEEGLESAGEFLDTLQQSSSISDAVQKLNSLVPILTSQRMETGLTTLDSVISYGLEDITYSSNEAHQLSSDLKQMSVLRDQLLQLQEEFNRCYHIQR